MTNKVQNLTLTALMAAVLCIAGPLVIPIGVVPISLINMALYLAIILLDKKSAVMSTIIYLLIGFIGLPVFSGFTGGAGKILGPTGGYLVGYLVLIWVAGSIMEKRRKGYIPAFIAGTLGLYLFGTFWLMYQSGIDFITALSIGVIPFIPFDMGKILAAVFLGNAMKKRMRNMV